MFAKYCAVCHGSGGVGDGRAAAVQEVPPANLTLSTRSVEYKLQIVAGGGRAMNRSTSMPAWGGELSATEIRDVVAHVETLSARRKRGHDKAQSVPATADKKGRDGA